jgi:hypothetical protein
MFYVEKHDGSIPWYIINDDNPKRMVRRTTTKKRATLLCAVLNGDISAAPLWYRAEYNYWHKMGESRGFANNDVEAARFVVMDARSMNLTPVQVNCDPNTGIPL